MRKSIIIACLILSCYLNSMKAQDTIPQNVMNKDSVKLIIDPSFTCYGALNEINDSSLSISSHRVKDFIVETLSLQNSLSRMLILPGHNSQEATEEGRGEKWILGVQLGH